MSLCKNWPLFHSSCFLSPFCDLTWLPHKSPFSTLPLKTLMKFRDALNFFTGMVFVIISTGFFFVLIFTKSTTLLSTTHWRILWYMWSFARWITLWLLQWSWTESYIIPKVSTNPLHHKNSFIASTTAMYSASVVERTTESSTLPSTNDTLSYVNA